MPYYIAEIRFNRTSKDVKSEKKVKKRLVMRLVTMLLACLLVLTPILIIPATVGSDQSVVIEALEDLREDVSNLPLGEEGFNNLRAAAGQRKALANKINATINQVKAGAYRGAVNKLKNDLNGTILRWVADEHASSLIEKVNNIIDLILDIFQPPAHDIAIIDVVPSVTQAYIGDSVGIDVIVANEGTESEIFDVYVYADIDTAVIGNEITIDNITGVSLEAEATTTLSVTWDTTSVVEGTYTISAKVPPVEGEKEKDTDNNLYTDGTVTLSLVLEHDVAVTGVSTPDEVIQGEVVTISVNVANPGDSDENFDVTVTYDTTSIGTQSVTLASNDFTTVLFNWNTTGVDPNTYTITAEAILAEDEDLTNNEASTTITVKLEPVHVPPVASFTENATTVLTGEVIHFNASESYDTDGVIVSYFWNFGDGTNAEGVIVDYAYADNGTYTVTLTVTDDDDLTDSATATKIINNRPPVALFTQNATTVNVEEAIFFDASNSSDLDGYIIEYFWNFGDELTPVKGMTVDYVYHKAGNYTVTLNVTDNDGATSTFIGEITVNAPPEIPWALFAIVGLSIAAAAATLLYLWYRRRKRKKAAATTVTKPPTKPAVTLYLPAKILTEQDKSSQSG